MLTKGGSDLLLYKTKTNPRRSSYRLSGGVRGRYAGYASRRLSHQMTRFFINLKTMAACLLLCASSAAAAAAAPKHFVVTLVDDLGGYNVPWRNPENTMADDLVTLSTKGRAR